MANPLNIKPDERKWGRRWYAVALVLLLLPVGLFLATRAWSDAPNLSATEKAVLDKLAAYGVRPELDADGHVQGLLLEGRHVTDEALADVHLLPHLRGISLRDSVVTDQGLLQVVKCRRLQNLGLTDARVTDAGLNHLHQLASLQNVWVVVNEKLTPRGIAALRKALPAVQVHDMSGPTPAKKNDGEPGTKKT